MWYGLAIEYLNKGQITVITFDHLGKACMQWNWPDVYGQCCHGWLKHKNIAPWNILSDILEPCAAL